MKNLMLTQMENVEGGRYSEGDCALVAAAGIASFVSGFFTGWGFIGAVGAAVAYKNNCNYRSYGGSLVGPAV